METRDNRSSSEIDNFILYSLTPMRDERVKNLQTVLGAHNELKKQEIDLRKQLADLAVQRHDSSVVVQKAKALVKEVEERMKTERSMFFSKGKVNKGGIGMCKIKERCYICQWWEHDKTIQVTRYDKDIQGYLGCECTAKCLYKHPPRGLPWNRPDYIYTHGDYWCSAFRIHSRKCREVIWLEQSQEKARTERGTISLVEDDRDDMCCDICRKEAKKLVHMTDTKGGEDEECLEICPECIEKAQKLSKQRSGE